MLTDGRPSSFSSALEVGRSTPPITEAGRSFLFSRSPSGPPSSGLSAPAPAQPCRESPFWAVSAAAARCCTASSGMECFLQRSCP